MSRSLTSIIALGVVSAIFMAIMSVFYRGQLPSQAELDSLEPIIRREHGIYLSSTAPVSLTLILPESEGVGVGVRLECALRPDIRRRPDSVDLHLDRIAETLLDSPELKGRINYVTAAHSAAPERSRTRHAAQIRAEAP